MGHAICNPIHQIPHGEEVNEMETHPEYTKYYKTRNRHKNTSTSSLENHNCTHGEEKKLYGGQNQYQEKFEDVLDSEQREVAIKNRTWTEVQIKNRRTDQISDENNNQHIIGRDVQSRKKAAV